MDPISHRMVAVRADMTPQIARIAATRLPHRPRPLRLSYAGQVLRVRATQMRPERQFGQVGFELIGALSAAADAEAILLAAESLAAIGIREVSIDLNLPTLAPAVACALGLDAETRAALVGALDRKDAAAVEAAAGLHAAPFVALISSMGPARRAMQRLNRLDAAEPILTEILRGMGDRAADDPIVVFTTGLLSQCLAARQRTAPDAWTTFHAMSLFGGVLVDQKNYADAEALLLQGYEGMKAREKTIPPQGAGPSVLAPMVLKSVDPFSISIRSTQLSFGMFPPPQSQLGSASASPAQMLSQAVSQQNGSMAQTELQHAGWLQPGVPLGTQQSFGLPSLHTPPPPPHSFAQRSAASSAQMPSHCTSPGSTLGRRRPSYSPPRPWKYHQGTPFTPMTTAVSGPSSGCIGRTTPGT